MVRDSDNLLDRARHGDVEAFAAVFEEHRPLLHRIACRMVGESDGEDVVMDTYIKVWRAIPRFRGESSIRTWLCRATRNCALDHLRRRSREQLRVARDEPDEEGRPLLERIPDASSPAPDSDALNRELGGILQDAISQLSEAHATTLLLREVDGLSYREVASATGVGIGTVMSRLFYARRQLRKILENKETGL